MILCRAPIRVLFSGQQVFSAYFSSRWPGSLLSTGGRFHVQRGEFVIAKKTWSSMLASLVEARYSFGYSSFDKSNSASGIGRVAVTVVPP